MKSFTLFILMMPCICLAQKNQDSLFFAKMHTKIIARSDASPATRISIPFKHLAVWDIRSDTTSVGFIRHTENFIKKINFKSGLSDEIFSYAKEHYGFNESDSNTLLILIKNFRISNFTAEAYSDDNNPSWASGAMASAELFIYNGKTYRALHKIDTVSFFKYRIEVQDSIPSKIFHLIFCKLENKNIADIRVGKKEFSYNQLKQHADEAAMLPVLKDSTLRKGVYKNFTEFKNNHPSIENFEIKKGELSDELYVINNNTSYPLYDCWGYCDGKNIYIRSSNNFFQLYRTGYTYNTRAFKSLKRKEYSSTPAEVLAASTASTILYGSPVVSGIGKPSVKYKAITHAFQLNMQTGDIF